MLINLKEALQYAEEKECAIGAFNVPNLESIKGVIEAAEELHVPVILQHAEVHENFINMEEIGPIMIQFAKNASIPVVVHLDHGSSLEACMKAIRLGFTSVMYDASMKEHEVNVEETKEIVKMAHAVNVSVEAELGHMLNSSIGGGEGRASNIIRPDDSIYTDPLMAKDFVERTKADCLAISFGTVHGVYVTKPELDLDRVKEIKDITNIPLVMHGGSGVSKENYRIAIKNGIRKINYYTYMNLAAARAVQMCIEEKDSNDKIFFDELSIAAVQAIKENVKEAISVFCEGTV